jgi:hypothetical protein
MKPHMNKLTAKERPFFLARKSHQVPFDRRLCALHSLLPFSILNLMHRQRKRSQFKYYTGRLYCYYIVTNDRNEFLVCLKGRLGAGG